MGLVNEAITGGPHFFTVDAFWRTTTLPILGTPRCDGLGARPLKLARSNSFVEGDQRLAKA